MEVELGGLVMGYKSVVGGGLIGDRSRCGVR